MTETTPRPPKSMGPAGRRLWDSVLGRFELEEHELTLLRQAASTADLCDGLQAALDRDGPVLDGRPNPVAVELRQQRLVLAKLIAAMRVPEGDADDVRRPQRRPLRGVYGVGPGGAA